MSRPFRLPTIPVPSAFDPLDVAVDEWFERHLRHRRLVDVVMYGASAVGDHGIVWLALAGVQARRRHLAGRPWTRQYLRVAIGLGLESVVVNGPVKFMFRRTRPVHLGPRPLRLRQPRTSSFPSGHATAAFFGAALLRDEDPIWPLYYALAVIVAASRVHVRIHHASDVIGGVVTGIALGELVRHLVPMDPAARVDPAVGSGGETVGAGDGAAGGSVGGAAGGSVDGPTAEPGPDAGLYGGPAAGSRSGPAGAPPPARLGRRVLRPRS